MELKSALETISYLTDMHPFRHEFHIKGKCLNFTLMKMKTLMKI